MARSKRAPLTKRNTVPFPDLSTNKPGVSPTSDKITRVTYGIDPAAHVWKKEEPVKE